MPLRRRTRWALAAGGVLVTLTIALCLHGGWRPFGATTVPLSAIPADVDVACRLDVASLRASPLLADPAVAGAIASAFDLPEETSLTDPMLGDDAAFASLDGCWLAVIRVGGPVHAARLGTARLFVETTGDGPVIEATLPSDDIVYVARTPGLWIVSDDEDLAAAALESAAGSIRSVLARDDLGGVFDAPSTAALWASDDASSYAVDAVRNALGDVAAAVAKAVPHPDSPFTLRLDAAADVRRFEVTLAWRGLEESEAQLAVDADLDALAKSIEDAAENAPPPKPRIEASDRVRLTIEVSQEGLSGEPLRAEVDKRIAERAAARVAGDAAAARLAAHRKSDLLRALGRLGAKLDVHDGDVRLTLTVGR